MERDTQMSIEDIVVENVADIEVVRMTGLLGAEVEFAVVLAAEVGIGIVAGVGFGTVA